MIKLVHILIAILLTPLALAEGMDDLRQKLYGNFYHGDGDYGLTILTFNPDYTYRLKEEFDVASDEISEGTWNIVDGSKIEFHSAKGRNLEPMIIIRSKVKHDKTLSLLPVSDQASHKEMMEKFGSTYNLYTRHENLGIF